MSAQSELGINPEMLNAEVTTVEMMGHPVEIYTAKNGGKMNVEPLLKDRADFHGDPNVHHLVRFGEAFKPLIGDHSDNPEWDKDKLEEMGIHILEYTSREAKLIIKEINLLATLLGNDPNLYEDAHFAKLYKTTMDWGYWLISNERPIGDNQLNHVSLERAGLVSTRAALAADEDAVLNNEVRVVTKRCHLIGESDQSLAVTVTFRDPDQLHNMIHGQEIVMPDFVNPASGASGIAKLLAAEKMGVKPSKIIHKSISATRQGILFVRQALLERGIQSEFYSVGDASILNDKYYLDGKPVGDAGHLLRHFLPIWYQQ